MGADHPKPPRELREYLVLLRQRDSNDQPFIIVGGHATNFWAEFYSEREPKLKALLSICEQRLGFDWHRSGGGASGAAHRLASIASSYWRRASTGDFKFRTGRRSISGRLPLRKSKAFPINPSLKMRGMARCVCRKPMKPSRSMSSTRCCSWLERFATPWTSNRTSRRGRGRT